MKRVLIILVFGILSTIILAQTKTELQPSELQKPILEYSSQNFKDYCVDKVFKVDAKGVITYDIGVNKDKTHEKLFFDKDGKFLRKESCSLECCQGPVKKWSFIIWLLTNLTFNLKIMKKVMLFALMGMFSVAIFAQTTSAVKPAEKKKEPAKNSDAKKTE